MRKKNRYKLFTVASVFIIAVVVMLYALSSKGASASAKVVLKPDIVKIGDTAILKIIVRSDIKTEVEFPDLEPLLEDFDIREISRTRKNLFREAIEHITVKLAKYLPGTYDIPSFNIRYRQTASGEWKILSTQAMQLRVRGVVDPDTFKEKKVEIGGDIKNGAGSRSDSIDGPAGSKSDITPIRYYIHDDEALKRIITPVDIAKRTGIIMAGVVVLGLIIVVLAAIFLVGKDPSEIPYHKKAVKALKALGSNKAVDVKDVCSELISIFSQYLRKRIGVSGSELTPDELKSKVSGFEGFTGKQKEFIVERLMTWSHIKYSGEDVRYDKKMFSSFKEEIRFIEETRPKEEE